MITKTKNFLYQTFLLATGSLLSAFAVRALLMDHGLLSPGLTGLSLIIHYKWTGLSVGVIYFIINAPVFALGWKFIGRRFIVYSFWGMFIYSLFLSFVNVKLTVKDPMLATIVASALSGTGKAFILRSYGSGGGSDILTVMLNKFLSVTLGTGAIVINTCILSAALLMFPVEKVLYTIVFIFISAQFTNVVFHGTAKRRTAIIISDKWETITETLKAHRIRVTLIDGKGGFDGESRTLLYSVLLSQSVPLLKRLVKEIDECAFVAIMQADDVTSVDIGNQPHW